MYNKQPLCPPASPRINNQNRYPHPRLGLSGYRRLSKSNHGGFCSIAAWNSWESLPLYNIYTRPPVDCPNLLAYGYHRQSFRLWHWSGWTSGIYCYKSYFSQELLSEFWARYVFRIFWLPTSRWTTGRMLLGLSRAHFFLIWLYWENLPLTSELRFSCNFLSLSAPAEL